MILSLPLTQGCAALALGYFRWLPTGANRWAAHGMADMEVHLELLGCGYGSCNFAGLID